ncbi:MAG: tetrahydromethanopterin S-methyltransferase subunit H [Candidatus Bathyarchaeia archaeon]
MFQYSKKQVTYDIGGIKVGGEIGENPTVMIGSIFYKGDKLVNDEKTGAFDKEKARELISKVEEMSERTGLSAMLDVVCTYPDTVHGYLEFAADATRMPLLIDAVSEEAALAGLECAKELGIIDRTILNSINPETREKVFEKIRETGLKSALLLTYSTKAIISSKERIALLEAMIPKVKALGVEKMLVDTVVIDIATLGLACKAIREVKEKFGLPVGCGAHNAISSWKSLKEKKDKTLTLTCSSVASSLPIAIGADFVLYGPISDAPVIFPAVSLINAAFGQALMEDGKRLQPTHPRFRIARF